MSEILSDWLPTPENINALPDPLRRYIHALETDCDPAGTIRSEVILRAHTVPELQASIAASRADALEEAAKLVEPKSKRPCNCETCYCGNHGDMEAVAAWDADAAAARSIRALIAQGGQ